MLKPIALNLEKETIARAKAICKSKAMKLSPLIQIYLDNFVRENENNKEDVKNEIGKERKSRNKKVFYINHG